MPVLGAAADPPPPLVLAEELLAGPGEVTRLAASGRLHHVVGQVLSTEEVLTPADRARAAALATSWRTGTLSRATAAWVWAGHLLPSPDVVDVGALAWCAPLSELGVVTTSTLPTRTVRCSSGTTVVRIGGVAVTDPDSTASECARLLPPASARVCLLALHHSGRCHLERTQHLLQADIGARGRRTALALVERLLTGRPVEVQPAGRVA